MSLVIIAKTSIKPSNLENKTHDILTTLIRQYLLNTAEQVEVLKQLVQTCNFSLPINDWATNVARGVKFSEEELRYNQF